MDLSTRIEKAAEYLRRVTGFVPEAGMILGSGLGDYAGRLANPVYVPYQDIPGFPVSTVAGHAGRFVLGERFGKRLIVMQGRFHAYEGYGQQELTMPVRVMKLLGAEKLLLTNAAGGVNLSFHPGTLMLLRDHINYSGQNPLTGPNLDGFGPRFPDMSEVYDKAMRGRLLEEAGRAGIVLEEGVYMMFSGPSYETPAEVRMARALGADAVGMSTVPEAIAAAHSGIRTLGVSCITNMAAGVLPAPLCHSEVVETANRVKGEFERLVDLILQKVF